MAGKQKSIFIRFNMEDKADRELYLKLSGRAGDSASLTAYVKRMLEENFTLNIKIADRNFMTRYFLLSGRRCSRRG